MIHNKKNQNFIHYGFTLIEMMIVLIIIGILLMMMLYLSSDQVQKVKDKTVKESILAEMQSRYSRNLGSSSYAGMIYDTMDVTFSSGSNEIDFKYNPRDDGESKENTFSDRFEIKYITKNFNLGTAVNPSGNDTVTLEYSPYQMSCQMGDGEKDFTNVVIIARVNDSRDYCFEIQQKNCRLIEISETKCETLKTLAKVYN